MTATIDQSWDGVRRVSTPHAEVVSETNVQALPVQPLPRKQVVALVAGVLLLSILVIEFIGGFFIQQRAQDQLRSEFSGTLATAASAFGQPGLSPLPDTAPRLGSAVALVSVPALGISQVAVEGSTSEYTRKGIAHVPGTVLPGQAGHAMLVGRRTSFGAPFAKLGSLGEGSQFVITTVEGVSTYKVIAKSTAADALPANLLTVVTSNPPILSISNITVQAELVGKPFPSTPRNNAVTNRADHVAEIIVLLQLLIAALIAIPFARRHFGSLITWLVLAPITLAVLVGLSLIIDSYLPATL